jgi:SAM-dependent methyltransferase
MHNHLPLFNDSNIGFYQYIKIDTFKSFAELQGFDTCIDVATIFPYLQSANVLLELGAGYGRVVRGLLERGFQGKIIAVERVAELIDYLKNNIPEIVVLEQQDLKKLTLDVAAEAITWMWSGILELSPTEQMRTIQHLHSLMAQGGRLFIEIPRKVKYVGVHIDEQRIKVEADWGKIDAYMPRHDELLDYGHQAGFSNITWIEYETNKLERIVYIFEK